MNIQCLNVCKEVVRALSPETGRICSDVTRSEMQPLKMMAEAAICSANNEVITVLKEVEAVLEPRMFRGCDDDEVNDEEVIEAIGKVRGLIEEMTKTYF